MTTNSIVELSVFEKALIKAKTPEETLKLEAVAKAMHRAALSLADEDQKYFKSMEWLMQHIKTRLKTTKLLEPYAPKLGGNWKDGRFTSTGKSANKVSWGMVKADLDENAEVQMTYKDWGRRKYELNLGLERIQQEHDDCIANGVYLSLPVLWKIGRSAELGALRAELAKRGKNVPLSDRWHMFHGDIQTWKAPRQYDFIITDPPYPMEYLPLYDVLAARAVHWLKPGGLMIAMSAHYHLNELYPMLDKHLRYFWTGSYLVLGESSGVVSKHVTTMWKPLLMYERKDAPFQGRGFSDVFKSQAGNKDNHEWGQSVSGMYDIISKMCDSGQFILDPFCGAGTTGIAALEHGCFFDGLDIDEQSVNISKARLHEQSK